MGDEKLLKDLGLRVSIRRKELHMTQENVAEQMDVSVQMISNLELGRKAIRPENMLRLCQVLNISADYLLTGIAADHDRMVLSDKIAQLPFKQQKIIEQLVDNLLEITNHV